jgi:4'-phosphopantetheinyl transferase
MHEESTSPLRRIVVVPGSALPRPPYRDDEVTVCVLQLDASVAALEELSSSLTDEERSRADRYRVASARCQFVMTRATLRQILGAHLGVPPPEVPIGHTGAGKPVLTGGDLHFNVTHTDGLALIALARQPVGIDVERVREIANPDGLVSRFFSPHEREEYLALPDALRPAGFFRGWTCKEALIKASGLSVAFLEGFDVELHPERPPALLAARHPVVAASPWSLGAWEPARGFVAAVALEGAGELRLAEA